MPNAPTIERRIHFYRSSVGSNPDGSPIPFDPLPALAAINQLSFADVLRGRYLVDQDGDALCAWPGTARNETTLKFCQVRRTDLPQVEQAGHVSDLPIGVTAGLLETVHVVFFPNNIVGAEFNFYGPRLSRLGNYLHFKSNGAVPFATFHPLVRGDAAQQLNQLQEIRVLDFKIKASYIQSVQAADQSLADAFSASVEILNDPGMEVELILRPSKLMRRSSLQRLIEPLRQLVRGPDLRDNSLKMQISGKCTATDRVETFDLLRDQLIVNSRILRMGERSRAVQELSAYEAIRLAYGDLRAEIDQAAELVRSW